MNFSAKFPRRRVLQGIAGASLALPRLELFAHDAAVSDPKRFCALYTANGMCLPDPKNGIDEWSWFPKTTGRDFVFGRSTEPFAPFRRQVSFLGGLFHPNGTKADPHVCSDMWLTGAPLHNPKPGTYNSVSLDQVIAQHTKAFCRQPSLVLSIDAGVGFLSRTGTISYNLDGRPIPAENSPRRVFDRLFRSNRDSNIEQRDRLKKRIRLVDAVLENSRSLNQQLGRSDREKLDQYLTSLNEIEQRLEASERWIDIPLKQQDFSHLKLDVTTEGEPAEYYRNMFDLIALAFDADITRSVAFMLNREDGMGISDTFPLKLGLSRTHHNLSHAGDPDGQLQFAKFDLFLSQQIAGFLERLQSYSDQQATVLENTIVLFGSGASTTHNPTNLPTLIAGGSNMGLNHGTYWRRDETPLCNLYLSILHAMGIPETSFGDSTGPLTDCIFSQDAVVDSLTSV
ncbi:MAG: DUF1552 domain-containing protein [Planctomycetaceae bacterium]